MSAQEEPKEGKTIGLKTFPGKSYCVSITPAAFVQKLAKVVRKSIISIKDKRSTHLEAGVAVALTWGGCHTLQLHTVVAAHGIG